MLGGRAPKIGNKPRMDGISSSNADSMFCWLALLPFLLRSLSTVVPFSGQEHGQQSMGPTVVAKQDIKNNFCNNF